MPLEKNPRLWHWDEGFEGSRRVALEEMGQPDYVYADESFKAKSDGENGE